MRISDLCVLLVLALLGCNHDIGRDDTGGGDDTGGDDTSDTFDPADTDHDGFTPDQGDCDDTNAAINPDAEEDWYDGVDQNCDALDDWDADGDGWVPPRSVHHGEPYTGTLPEGDCNDSRADVHPGATEVWYDGVDMDCLRDSDWDQDGDEHVPPDNVTGGLPYIGVLPKDDCDDTKADVNPEATETCATAYDDDCDGFANPTTTPDATTWYLDGEGDGYGVTDTATEGCTAPGEGWVALGGDCDDTSDVAYPGAPTVACDGFDNDCNPATFETSVVKIGDVTYANLAAAVTAAAPSDTISLCEGKHTISNLRIQKALTIDGLGHADTVIVDANNQTAFWLDTVDPVVLRDVTVTRGHGRFSDGTYRGGAVYLTDGGSLLVDSSEILDNSADTGAGIYVGPGGALTIAGGHIARNTGVSSTVPSGGGIWLGAGATLSLEDTTIELNTSGGGGGITGDNNNTITGIGDAVVTLNEAELSGAGILLKNGGTISGVQVVDNSTDNSGGGFSLEGAGTYNLTDMVISGNYGGLVGGGIDGGGTMNLTRVEISNNHGGITGGGLHLVGSVAATLTDCSVTDNFTTFFADVSGGAYLSSSTLVSVNTDWGTDDNGDDNHPADVWLDQSDEAWDYGDGASFTCTDSASGTCVDN